MKIKRFNEYVYEGISNEELRIINDILSTNEGFGDWFNKFVEYGKKGLLTAGIILTIAFSAQAENTNKTNDVIKQGIELASSDVKNDVYSFMIGISKENVSLSMKKGDIDSAGAFKEISKYYQDLKTGKKPLELTNHAKKYMKVISEMYENLDQEAINHFIRVGNKIINYE